MQLSNAVVVSGDPDALFDLLLDVEKVASCMPGSSVTGRDGDSYNGTVRVKLGPLSLTYSGTVRFLEVDAAARSASLSATGREQNGQGDVQARVQASVSPDPLGALLSMETDLVIRGRVAQFGRGVVNDVSQQLMQEFAESVGRLLEAGGMDPSADEDSAPLSGSAGHVASPAPVAAASLDGYRLLVLPMLRRAAPAAVALVVGLAVAAAVLGRRRRP